MWRLTEARPGARRHGLPGHPYAADDVVPGPLVVTVTKNGVSAATEPVCRPRNVSTGVGTCLPAWEPVCSDAAIRALHTLIRSRPGVIPEDKVGAGTVTSTDGDRFEWRATAMTAMTITAVSPAVGQRHAAGFPSRASRRPLQNVRNVRKVAQPNSRRRARRAHYRFSRPARRGRPR